jgi:hypothetical protein
MSKVAIASHRFDKRRTCRVPEIRKAYLTINLVGRTCSSLILKGAVAALIWLPLRVPFQSGDQVEWLIGSSDRFEGMVKPDDLNRTIRHGGVVGHQVWPRPNRSYVVGDAIAIRRSRTDADKSSHCGDEDLESHAEHFVVSVSKMFSVGMPSGAHS